MSSLMLMEYTGFGEARKLYKKSTCTLTGLSWLIENKKLLETGEAER